MGKLVGAAAMVLFSFAACAGLPRGGSAAADWYNVGNAYVDLGQYDKAVAAFQQALRLDPGLAKADFNLALVYARTGRGSEAAGILERLLGVDPQNTQVRGALAWTYHLAGRDEEALAQYEALLALSPADTDALYNSGVILWKLDRPQEAVQRMRAVLARTPEDTDALFAAGSLLLSLGDPAASEEMLSRYLAKKPDDKDALQLLAASAERRELYARALDAYDRILALDARQADALFAEARILLTAVQDPQKGLDMLARALGAGFDDAERIRALVEAPDLLDREAVEAALKDKGLLPEAGAAAAPAGQ